MGSLCNYAEDAMLDHLFEGTALTTPASVWVGLHVGDPTETGAGGTGEVSGNAYARKQITFGAPASRVITSSGIITFPTATGSWGTVDYFVIYDAETTGNPLAYGALASARAVGSGQTPSFASGQFTITFNANEWADYGAESLLNHLFRSTTWTQPTIYVALCEAAITDSNTGATIDEMEMTGYAREAVSGWAASSGGATSNTGLIDFSTLTNTGETVEAIAIVDNATTAAGNLICYDNSESQAIADGDTVQIPIGDVDITLT